MNGTRFEPIKHEFVDREPERGRYGAIACGQDQQRIFCLQAEDGWGKSWLLARLYLDTPDQKCFKVVIDLGSTKVKDEEALLENIAEEMGGPISEHMAEAMETSAGKIDIKSERDTIIHGDVAINKVVVNHQGGSDHLSVELQDPHGYGYRVRNLTRAFIAGLEALPPSKQAILFLDRFEKATKPTRDWLVDQLLTGMRDGEFPNLIAVVASTQPFDFLEAREWRYTAVHQHLQGLPEDAVREYWVQKRRLPEGDLQTILKLLRTGGFSPSALSNFADMIEQTTATNQA
jgi:hypothetical protein